MYSLNLYEDLPKNQKIKPSTEPDYSFNFTLFEEESYPNPYHGAGGSYGRLQKKVEELEAKLALAAARDEEDQDEEGGIMGTINGYLEDPRTKDFIMNKIFGFVDGMLKTPAPGAPVFNLPEQRQPAQVGKVTEEHLLTEDQTTKLQTAVGILATIDPNLGDNLLKIASVAQKDRMKYNQLIGLLNNFL